MEAMLTAMTCGVTRAKDCDEAIAALDAWHFDLVFLDVARAPSDTEAALRRLRARHAALLAPVPPIVALLADGKSVETQAWLDAGMDAALRLPVARQELAALLREWLPGGIRVRYAIGS